AFQQSSCFYDWETQWPPFIVLKIRGSAGAEIYSNVFLRDKSATVFGHYSRNDNNKRSVISNPSTSRVLKKRLRMLREPQHERKIMNNIKSPPFVLSVVEGLPKGSAPCQCSGRLLERWLPTHCPLCPRVDSYSTGRIGSMQFQFFWCQRMMFA